MLQHVDPVAHLKSFGIIDEIVPEPAGGANIDPEVQFRALDRILEAQLAELSAFPPESLAGTRYEKFRRMGRLGQEFKDVPSA